MGLAERLAGDMTMHIAYAAPLPRAASAMARPGPGALPRLASVAPRALAAEVAAKGAITVPAGGLRHRVELPRSAAPLIARIGGRPLSAIAAAEGLDWIGFSALWAPVDRALTGFNLMHYTRFPA
jgi:hypothetical protein